MTDWRDRMAARTLRREGAAALVTFGYSAEQVARAQAILDAEAGDAPTAAELHCRLPLCCGIVYCNCHCARCDEARHLGDTHSEKTSPAPLASPAEHAMMTEKSAPSRRPAQRESDQ